MREPILAVTGDTHGEEGRFLYVKELPNRYLDKGDYLFICGDFGYIWGDTYRERQFLKYLANDIPYTILFCDGNHENFELLYSYAETEWNGGKVHVIKNDSQGNPKVIHLMRGQVYEIEGKKIFVFGGGYSIDKAMRTEGISWWSKEMPSEEEKDEAVRNLEAVGWEVDYIITHTAPEETMFSFHPDHINEAPLNNFLEYIRERTKYKHWYMGHLHQDCDLWRHQSVLWFGMKNMKDNSDFE